MRIFSDQQKGMVDKYENSFENRRNPSLYDAGFIVCKYGVECRTGEWKENLV